MSIAGSFQENRAVFDFQAEELVAGVLAAEKILELEGFALGVRVGCLEDAEWSGRTADEVVGNPVFYLIAEDGEYVDGLERMVFLDLDDVLEKLDGFHEAMLDDYCGDVLDCNGRGCGKEAEVALILMEDDGRMRDLWKTINACVYQDVYVKCVGDRKDFRMVHQMVFAGEGLEKEKVEQKIPVDDLIADAKNVGDESPERGDEQQLVL